MPKPPRLEKHPPEFDFEDGLKDILCRIDELLAGGKKYVVVAINGSASNVGKTYLSGRLCQELSRKRVPFVSCPDPHNLHIAGLLLDQKNFNSNQGVIIFNAFGDDLVFPEEKMGEARNAWDAVVQSQGSAQRLPIRAVDIWIALDRPDKPFQMGSDSQKPLCDVVIHNEQAVDKR